MKQLPITPKITEAVRRSTDGSVEASTVAVYEIAAFNTLPVNKYGLFAGARASETTLREMATYLNTGTNFAPLQVEHDQGINLPVGRVFAGEVVKDDQGVAELRVLMYIPKGTPEGDALIAKLDSGVVDEVSVGLQAKHLNCSECGFDYRGEDATFSHLYNGICANEHEVGANGTHVIMNGMDKFYELSLVSRGAAQKTKVLSRAKSVMGDDAYNALAASGQPPEIITLFATPTPTKGPKQMDMEKLIGDLTTAKASVQVKEGELTAAKAEVTQLSATVATLTTENAALKASADVTKITGLETTVATLTASVNEALGFVREEAKRLAVAASLPAPADDLGLEGLKASIETSRTKLRETFPQGGVAPTQVESTAKLSGANTAFKTR